MPLHFLLCFIFFNLQQSAAKIGCQHKSTLGRDYRGKANTTSQGLRCQRTLYWLRNGNQQGQGLMVKMFAKKTNTVFDVSVSGVRFQKSSTNLYFPLQWTRTCLSVDSTKTQKYVLWWMVNSLWSEV